MRPRVSNPRRDTRAGTPTSGALGVDFRDPSVGSSAVTSCSFPGAIYGLVYVRGRETTVVAPTIGVVAAALARR
jgi:hypothetical protein